jgi:hypothetical protein
MQEATWQILARLNNCFAQQEPINQHQGSPVVSMLTLAIMFQAKEPQAKSDVQWVPIKGREEEHSATLQNQGTTSTLISPHLRQHVWPENTTHPRVLLPKMIAWMPRLDSS